MDIKSVFLLIFFAALLKAEVREIFFMEEILSEIDDDTIIGFDIDNTLIMPKDKDQKGSDQHFYYLVNKLKKLNFSHKEASRIAEEIWNDLQLHIATKTVEIITPELILGLQKKPRVFALTKRSFSIADITRQQLLDNNIDFSINPICSEKMFKLNEHSFYSQGILYQGEASDKGETLLSFFERLGLRPKKFIFVDDKEENAENINRALKSIPIIHIEYRYGAMDEAVKDFRENYLEEESEANDKPTF